MSIPTKPAKGEATVLLLLALYLPAIFLWRYLVPAHEYPMRLAQVLSMVLDGLAIVALIALRVRRSNRFRPQDTERSRGSVLYWLALAAGVGLFVIRMQSDPSWWTGHRLYRLAPMHTFGSS